MALTFANFKQVIPAQILAKGREYARGGRIVDLSFDEAAAAWDAQVEGTDLYDVCVEQSPDGELITSCTCPYDMGEHCKHVAAVLYAIEESFPEQLQTRPRKKSGKRQTRHDKLRQSLEKTSREELIAILLELAAADREILNQLIIRLGAAEAKPADFRKVVRDALRSGQAEYGFLDYSGSRRAAHQLFDLLSQAVRWIDSGEVSRAVAMFQALLDETVPAINHADDSSGELGEVISMAVQGLSDSIPHLDKPQREDVFAYCLDRAQKGDFRGWDWAWDLLNIAAEMANDPSHRSRLNVTLDAMQPAPSKYDSSGFSARFALERIALFKLSLIDRFDGAAAARDFLHEHVQLDALRIELIERCVKQGESAEAMRLIQEGIASSKQQRLPGLTNQYQKLLVDLLRSGGDTAALVEAATRLWLDRGDPEEFELIRKHIPSADWPAAVEKLIRALQKAQNVDQLAWLYAAESRWSDLLALIQSHHENFWLVEKYHQTLGSRFPDETSAIYERIIDAIMSRASGRSHYQQAAAYVTRIKRLGRPERAQAVVDRLQKQYPNRPALHDELRRS